MRIKGRSFTYVVNKAGEGGYTAHCIELPQVHTEGETLAEVKKNMRDALSLTMDYLREKAKKEKFSIENMLQNHKLAKSLTDASVLPQLPRVGSKKI